MSASTFTPRRMRPGTLPFAPLRPERAPLVAHGSAGAGYLSWSRRQPDAFRSTAALCAPRVEEPAIEPEPEPTSVYSTISAWAIVALAVLVLVAACVEVLR